MECAYLLSTAAVYPGSAKPRFIVAANAIVRKRPMFCMISFELDFMSA